MSHEADCCCNPCWVAWTRSLPPPLKRLATPAEAAAIARAAKARRQSSFHGTYSGYIHGCLLYTSPSPRDS